MIASAEPLERRICLDAGQLDTSFGDGGQAFLAATGDYPDMKGGAVAATLPMSDGRFFGIGSTGDYKTYVARFMPNGTPDPTFPIANLLQQYEARYFTPTSYGLTSDEKLLIAGTRFGGEVNTPIMLRLTRSGKIDHTFGHNGVARVGLETPYGITVLPDGRIVLTGNIHNDIDPEKNDDVYEAMQGIAILKPNGKPDTRFDKDGVVETSRTSFVNDSLYPTRESVGYERIFPLNGDRLLYLRGMSFSETFWDYSDRNRGTQTYGDIIAKVFNVDGTIDESFNFDRSAIDALLPGSPDLPSDFGPQYAGRYLAGGAEQLPDGSVQIAFVIDTTPIDSQAYPEEHIAKFNAYTATIGLDGSLSAPTLLATDYPSRQPMFLRDPLGNVLLVDEHGTFTRYGPGGSPDPTFQGDPSLTQEFRGAQSAFFSNDGQIVASYTQYTDTNGPDVPFVAKIQTSDAPSGVLTAPPIRQQRDTAYRFTIAWHDEDEVRVASLASPSIIVHGSDGTTRTAVPDFIDATSSVDDVVVHYHLVGPGGSWDAADNGVYHVWVRGRSVFDLNGHATPARKLGLFSVAITS